MDGRWYCDFYLLLGLTLFFGGSKVLNLLFFFLVGLVLFKLYFRACQFGRLFFGGMLFLTGIFGVSVFKIRHFVM